MSQLTKTQKQQTMLLLDALHLQITNAIADLKANVLINDDSYEDAHSVQATVSSINADSCALCNLWDVELMEDGF
jgi:adenosyl cobinamide kinase/adenosyl cobinamide phosphate guanylyltransferase